jgi:hypothetical protein
MFKKCYFFEIFPPIINKNRTEEPTSIEKILITEITQKYIN